MLLVSAAGGGGDKVMAKGVTLLRLYLVAIEALLSSNKPVAGRGLLVLLL